MENLVFPLSRKEAEKNGKSYSSAINRKALFPQRLRGLRKEKGISQQKLADDIGVTKSTISLYEQGDNVPDIKTFVRIADYYNVSYDYLLGKSDAKKRETIDIVAQTGLSEETIINLIAAKNLSLAWAYKLFDIILKDMDTTVILANSIVKYTESLNQYNCETEKSMQDKTLTEIAEKKISQERKEYEEWRLTRRFLEVAKKIAEDLLKDEELFNSIVNH